MPLVRYNQEHPYDAEAILEAEHQLDSEPPTDGDEAEHESEPGCLGSA